MIKLTGSVGKNGKNVPEDVKAVQVLLNKHQAAVGYGKLAVGGTATSDTLKAIALFQKAIKMPSPDGRVDPGGKTLTALESKDSPVDTKGAAKGEGRVLGNVSGVQADIIAFTTEVAKFYGQDIKITSGKRDARKQGEVMFEYWDVNLKRGKIYNHLKSNPKLLAELESLYVDAAEDKKKPPKEAAQAKASFIKICSEHAAKLSSHVAGRAIDIAPKSSMSKAMRDAMKTCLRELEEKSCFHYDTTGTVGAATDAVKQKWKAP